MSDSALSDAIRNALAQDGAELALEFHGAQVDWHSIQRVARELEALLSRAGLARGSVIGFVPRNRPAFAAAMLALIEGERTLMMVYAFQSPEAMARDIAALEAPCVIADAEDWNATTIAALPPGALGIALDSALDAREPVRLIAGDPKADRSTLRAALDSPRIELLSSGTTGAPRRHPLAYETLRRGIIGSSVIDVANKPGERGEPATVNFPLSNISGIYSYLPNAVARRPVLLMEKFDLGEWLSFVRRHRPTAVILPPAGIRMMLEANRPVEDMASVRYVMAGTSPIDLEDQRAFEDRYDLRLLLSYGATEFAGAATAMTIADLEKYGREKFGSVGRPQPGNDVKVVDPESGEALPAGRTGRLLVRIGALGPDYIRTTDLGRLDEDGYLFHEGRADGVILRGGFKILPSSVEAVLNRFPGLSACCVVGKPDRRLGQVPAALIAMKPGVVAPGAAALERHVRASLPATHVPVEFRVVESLPRTSSLKVDLGAVRALFE